MTGAARAGRRIAPVAVVLTVSVTLLVSVLVTAAVPRATAAPSDVQSSVAASGPLVVRPVGPVAAGTTAVVEVTGVGPAGVTLTATGSAGVDVEHAAGGPIVRVPLGPAVTAAAGSWTLVARADDRLATGTLTVTSGPAVGPVVAVVGARSIVADGRDQAMVVATPTDRFGNSVVEGTEVAVGRRRPDGSTTSAVARVSHLLVWSLLASGTRAGTGGIWLSLGPVTGPVATLQEVAAPPAPFTVAPVDPAVAATAVADGHALVAVRTSVLTDAVGNVEPDGTAVTFTWTAPDGVARADAVTVAGVATVSVPAPSAPGPVSVTAMCRGTAVAGALPLTFATAVGTLPVTVTRTTDGAVQVSVGPVLGPVGAYVPDGTVATAVGGSSGNRVSARLVSGATILTLPTLPAGASVAVDVLGATRTVRVTP